jgi:hypothetical protein
VVDILVTRWWWADNFEGGASGDWVVVAEELASIRMRIPATRIVELGCIGWLMDLTRQWSSCAVSHGDKTGEGKTPGL